MIFVLGMLIAGLSASRSVAADKPPEVLAAVKKGLDYLQKNLQVVAAHEAGLVAYTFLSAGEPADGPAVRAMIDKILLKFSTDGYRPTHHHTYEAGVDAMALAAADREKYRDKIQLIVNFLFNEQRPSGAWDYLGEDHGGDTSISQYGMLGLWAASRAGIEIPPRILDQAAGWHLRTQLRNGAWSYQPMGSDPTMKHSMTVAGAGTLGIVKLLSGMRPQEQDIPSEDSDAKTKKSDKAFGILERVTPKELVDQPAATTEATYKLQVSRKDLDGAIGRGFGWLSTNYTVDKNVSGWHLYYLYGLERAASLANIDKIGGHDWYTEGYRVLLRMQDAADGGWNDIGGRITASCFAVLFLVRATEKLVPRAAPPRPNPKAPTFGGGLLAGGRGLPTDLANVETKEGGITAKKTDTPLDKLLAELENPKSQKIESAQAALVEAVQVGQREQLIGQKDLLLKLAKDSRVDVRRTAFWALARCNDLRVAPVLIQGLMDPDYDAAVEARNALCVLSRRPRGFGLPDDLIEKLPEGASQAEKDAAFERWRDEDLRRWREWYQNVRPYAERDKLPD